jgi:hypothetical protein
MAGHSGSEAIRRESQDVPVLQAGGSGGAGTCDIAKSPSGQQRPAGRVSGALTATTTPGHASAASPTSPIA